MYKATILAVSLLVSFSSHASDLIEYKNIGRCVESAATQYGIAPELIYKLIRVESDGNYTALNYKGHSMTDLSEGEASKLLRKYILSDASVDVGLMQINIFHLRRSIKITDSELIHLLDPCYNIRMGAYIMAHRFYKLGYSWVAVGSYNVGINGIKGNRGSRLRKIGLNYIDKVNRAKGSPLPAWSVSGRSYIYKEKNS